MPLAPPVPKALLNRFATWSRLEPRCRSEDLTRGVQARTADPLWFIARQWQVGELRGEDAGSPVEVALTHSLQPVDRVELGIGDGSASEALNGVPLEVRVEAEPLPLDWRARIQIGQQFERFLRIQLGAAAGSDVIERYRAAYPLRAPDKVPENAGEATLDRETQRFVELMSGRVIDGKALLQAIKDGALIDVDDLPAQEKANAVDALEQWRAALCYQPSKMPAAWQPDGLRYQLKLNTGVPDGASRTPLIAPECRNGELDWHSFSAPATQGNDLGDFDQAEVIKVRPTRIRVRGTSPRWWEFEDTSLDLGNLDTARPDLAKLLLMEFVLVYGDDWFSVPLPVKCGKLVRIDCLKVRTTFGEEFDIKNANRNADIDPLKRWEVFSIDRDKQQSSPGLPNVLLVPPLSGARQESKPLEEIRFLRDEGANMVWAVENTLLNGLGCGSDGWAAHFERKEREREAEIARIRAKLDPLEGRLMAVREGLAAGGLDVADRAALEGIRANLVEQVAPIRSKLDLLERERAGGAPPVTDVPRYRLATTVPAHWIPFIPAREPPLPAEAEDVFKPVGLQRAQMLRNTEDEEPVLIDATSRLLGFDEGDPIIWLDEATVPRSGLKLQLTAQRTRGADGKTYVWLGRKVLAGRGEGSSGLRFDVVDEGSTG